MADSDLVSVIVSISSSVENLKKCLDSLSLQTYQNLEFICVNKFSDSYIAEILEEYAKSDKRFIIINCKDIDLLEAKNIGFKNVRGKYVSFVNSCDRVSLNLYSKFIQSPVKPDIYIFNGYDYEKNTKDVFPKYFFSTNEWSNHKDDNTIHSFADNINPFHGQKLVVNKIFKTEFLKSIVQRSLYGKLFENGYFEDLFFFFITMLSASSIIVNNDPLYYRSKFSSDYEEGVALNIFDVFEVMGKIEDLLRKTNRYELYKYAFFQYKYQKYAHLFFKVEENYREKFYVEMQKHLRKYENENMIPAICERLVLFGVYKNILRLNQDEFYEKYRNKI